MDEASGTVMHDTSSSGLDGTIGSAVAIGGGTYQFPGWTGYNVVQKARADDGGGFWKLELGGSGTALGKVRWVISDGSHSVVVTGKRRIDDGAWHTVVAERRGDQSVLTVDGVSATASAKAVGDIHPKGKYSGTMTVGKKPGSTDPKDAFAGWLDDLVTSR
jgi:hypothetical protein